MEACPYMLDQEIIRKRKQQVKIDLPRILMTLDSRRANPEDHIGGSCFSLINSMMRKITHLNGWFTTRVDVKMAVPGFRDHASAKVVRGSDTAVVVVYPNMVAFVPCDKLGNPLWELGFPVFKES